MLFQEPLGKAEAQGQADAVAVGATLHLFISKCNPMPTVISTEIRALTALSAERRTIKELAEAIGATYRRTAQIVKALVEKGFVTRTGTQVGLADTVHAVLFRKLSRRYDMEKLLGHSRENVALALLDADDAKRIREKTGLTYWTIKRALNKMMETGAVRERQGRYYLADDEDLRLFLRSWREEKERRLVEPYAEVVYASPEMVLKRVPHGRHAKGSLTAFSLFAPYGVELRPIYDYYVQPEREPTLEEVLVHAIAFSTGPVELTDCSLLLAKTRGQLDLGKARDLARKLGVEAQLFDLENYVRNLTVSSPERFLPWSEFAEKARMYGVDARSLLPPEAFPDLFKLLDEQLEQPVGLYVFGGEAMRMRGLKMATKDVDIALEDEASFKLVEQALRKMGYRPLGGKEVTAADRRLEPSGLFVKGGYPRMDLFVRRICNAFLLSDSMRARAEPQTIGRLRLHIMSNEDLLLLKSITDREGDIYDMITLAKTPGFNWKTVIEELYRQEEMTGRHFCRRLLDSVEVIEKRSGVRAPFYHQLANHCIDQAILEAAERRGARSLREIRRLVSFPDYRLRRRIAKLVKEGKLAVSEDGLFVRTRLD